MKIERLSPTFFRTLPVLPAPTHVITTKHGLVAIVPPDGQSYTKEPVAFFVFDQTPYRIGVEPGINQITLIRRVRTVVRDIVAGMEVPIAKRGPKA